MPSWTRTDRTIFTTAIVCLIFLSALLYDDQFFFSQSARIDQPVIGKISISSKDVRRKNMEQFFWQPAQQTDKIYNKDSIFTGENSEAEVTLDDGSKIQIQENSLVQIKQVDNNVRISLQDGWVKTTLKQGQTLYLDQDGKELALNSTTNGEVRLRKTNNGKIDVIVDKGTATIGEGKRKTMLQSDTPFVINDGKVTQESEISLFLEQPPRKAIELVDGEEPEISFKMYGPIQNPRLNFESTAGGNQIKVQIKNNAPQWPRTFPTGRYKVHLEAMNKVRRVLATSNERTLDVITLPTPSFVNVKPLHTFIIKPNSDGSLTQNMLFEWSKSPVMKNYIFEFTRTDFSQSNVLTKLIEGSQIEIPQLNSGIYSVRVRGQGQSKQTPWSSIYKFQLKLESEEIYRPTAPRLAKAQIDFTPIKNRSGDYVDLGPMMSWINTTKDPNLTYQLQLSSREDFAAPIQLETTKNQWEWKSFYRGQYFFRVAAKNQRQLTSAFSEVGRLNIQMPGIELKPIEAIQAQTRNLASLAPVPVELEWTKSPRAQGYKIEMSTDDQFSNPTVIESKDTKRKLEISKPGKYFTRVLAVDSAGKNLQVTSNTQLIDYEVTVPLEQPKILEPRPESSIFVQDIRKPYVTIRWSQVVGANYYQLEIAKDPEFQSIVKTIQSTANKTMVLDQIPSGNLFWRVKAYAKLKRRVANVTNFKEFSDWSDKGSFNLNFGDSDIFEK